jgi:hypothetical protein
VKPYLVLAIYRPSRWRASTVGQELTAITQELGLQPHQDSSHGPLHLTGRNWVSFLLHAEVRRRTFATKQAEGWHWDSDLDPNGNPNCAIVTWASNNGTQIKWRGEEKIYQPSPYEVVVFNNSKCVHRRPPNCPRVRWLFRQRICLDSAKHLELP